MAKQSVTQAMVMVLRTMDGEPGTPISSFASVKACAARGLIVTTSNGYEMTDAGRAELAKFRAAQAEVRRQERAEYKSWQREQILAMPKGSNRTDSVLSESAARALRYYAGAGEFATWGAEPPADLAVGTRELVAARHVRAFCGSYELTTSGAAILAAV